MGSAAVVPCLEAWQDVDRKLSWISMDIHVFISLDILGYYGTVVILAYWFDYMTASGIGI